ncbi:MAG: ComEC/Rec2 family competence protein [Capsulimonadaceae bacterium]|nr:ComEC/Rec2 family competence protein [Capsulimonadaceae bacterium]
MLVVSRPLFVLSVAFMFGIGAGSSNTFPVTWTAACVFASLAGILVVGLSGRFALLGALISAVAAGALCAQASLHPRTDDIGRLAPAPIALIDGTVVSDPDVRPGRAIFYVACKAATAHGIRTPCSGTAAVTVSLPRGSYGFDFHDGDRVVIVGTLEKPSGSANPGLDSWAEYLARRGIWCQIHARRPASVTLEPGGSHNLFRQAAWASRSALLASLRRILPRTEAAVLAGVLLGLRTDLPFTLLSAFIATGTIHILATAGLHVGILYKAILDFLRWLTVPRKGAAIGTIAFLWLYDLMAGGRIAVTRAVIMASIYLVAIAVERTPDVLNSLGGAALTILAFAPGQLFDAGFQASFAAVLMIALLMPVWERLWRGATDRLRSGWLKNGARHFVTLAGLNLFAQAGAAPVVARAFNVVSLAGGLANLIVVPLLFYLIPAGLALAIFGVWASDAARILASVLLTPVIRMIVASVTAIASMPGASLTIASPPVARIFAYYVLAAFALLKAERWLNKTIREAQP